MDWKIWFIVFLTNREFFFEYIDLVDPKCFKNGVMTNIFILIKKFVSKYKKMPDFDTLSILLDRLPDSESANRKSYVEFIQEISNLKAVIDIDVMKGETQRALQTYEMEEFILRTANKVGNISFDMVMADIRTIMGKYGERNLGVEVGNAKNAVSLIRHDPVDKISTGKEPLDKMLYGGYGVNEIFVVMAPPGRGKSYYLVNSMYDAMLTRKNVLYVTCELSEKAVLKRLYSRISYSTRKEMLDEEAVVKAANKFFTLSGARGRICYFPSKSLSVAELENVIEQQQLYFDFVPDMVIVDYLDLLAPNKMDFKSDPRHRLRGITDDLRSIALRRNMAIVTATQANRASLSKAKVSIEHVSESFGKIEVADVVLAICQTEEERKIHRARLLLLKNRDYVSGGCIECYVDFERMILMDVDAASKMGVLNDVEERTEVETEAQAKEG